MSRVIVGFLVGILVLGMFIILPDNSLTQIEGYNATQVAQNRTVQAHQTTLALTPTLTPLPTHNPAICLPPSPDRVVTISENIPTAWDAFGACFKKCVEANGGQIDVTNFEWWLQQNGYDSVESANIVHYGDQFTCVSKDGWLWS
jgi:hypothetical protein